MIGLLQRSGACIAVAVVLALVGAPSAQAQVCTPACRANTICVWVNTQQTVTNCIPAGVTGKDGETDVAEVVIEGTRGGGLSFKELVDERIVPIFDAAIMPLLYALAFIFFLIGMVRYFFFGGEEAREKGKQLMLWGIIGFVVIFSIWGIVKLILATFGA